MEELRKRIAALLDARAAAQTDGEAVIEAARKDGRALSDDEQAKFEEFRGAKKAADDELAQLQIRLADLEDEKRRDDAAAELRKSLGQVGTVPASARGTHSEPEIYTRSGQSWFRDMREVRRGNSEAGDRLTRNNRMQAEKRFDLSTTAGQGGEFAPPLWLIADWIMLARAGRVTADLIGAKTLPAGVSSVNLPKVATGTAAAVQSSQGTALQDTALTTSSVTSGIVTIGAQQTVSLQLLEQSGINFDDVILTDMAAAYAVSFDTQVLTAAASAPWNGGGLQNVSGQNVVTYTQASPVVAGAGQFYAKVAQAVMTIATTRFLPATAILMHPRRWGWILAAFDSQNRPLVVPSGTGYNVVASDGPVDGNQKATAVGQMLGLPVYTDANIPTNLSTGGGSNEDVAYVLREDDLYLYETDLAQASFDATYANSLEMLFRVHAYAAAIFNRYPASICSISGTGMNGAAVTSF